ncbi:MAG: hypothetical protein R2932_45720 [Caldilineaceae bacterium]
MRTLMQTKVNLKLVTVIAMLSLMLPTFMTADVAHAKGGNQNRERFYGIVQAKPAALQGTWIIGGRTIKTVSSTQFRQVGGKLAVGVCAKVDIRNGKVHEIDREPMRNCR